MRTKSKRWEYLSQSPAKLRRQYWGQARWCESMLILSLPQSAPGERSNTFQLKTCENSLYNTWKGKEGIRCVHKKLLNLNCNLTRLLILTETGKKVQVLYQNNFGFQSIFHIFSPLSWAIWFLRGQRRSVMEFICSKFFSLVLHKQLFSILKKTRIFKVVFNV